MDAAAAAQMCSQRRVQPAPELFLEDEAGASPGLSLSRDTLTRGLSACAERSGPHRR